MYRIATGVGLVLLLVAGCDGGTEVSGPDPEDALIGMWQMVAVDGQQLPWLEDVSPHWTWQITGGTMRFSPTSGSQFRYCRHYSGPTHPAPHTVAHTDEFGWSVEGDVIAINFFYASGIRTDFATTQGDELVLERTFEVPDRFYHFVKVADAPGAMPGC